MLFLSRSYAAASQAHLFQTTALQCRQGLAGGNARDWEVGWQTAGAYPTQRARAQLWDAFQDTAAWAHANYLRGKEEKVRESGPFFHPT